jgi:hypothetical protein
MKNIFPDRLREIAEMDEYLVRVQRSLAVKTWGWNRRNLSGAAHVSAALRARIVEVRKALRAEIEKLVLDIPIVTSARGVKHLPIMPFLRLAMRLDVARASSPATWWRYCGLGVTGPLIDAIYNHRYPGTRRFSTQARREVSEIRRALNRHDGPYRRSMDAYRDRQLKRGVLLARAIRQSWRYMEKLFLKHLWRVWRRQEGLAVGEAHENDETFLASPFGWA